MTTSNKCEDNLMMEVNVICSFKISIFNYNQLHQGRENSLMIMIMVTIAISKIKLIFQLPMKMSCENHLP